MLCIMARYSVTLSLCKAYCMPCMSFLIQDIVFNKAMYYYMFSYFNTSRLLGLILVNLLWENSGRVFSIFLLLLFLRKPSAVSNPGL